MKKCLLPWLRNKRLIFSKLFYQAKPIHFLGFILLAFLVGSCESEYEKNIAEELEGAKNSGITILALPTTKAGSTNIAPLWATGEKVGLFMECDGQMDGAYPMTLKNISGSLSFVEPIPFINYTKEHTYYAYHPYEASTSKDPRTVQVTPVPTVQTQKGTSNTHLNEYEYNIAEPVKIYPGDDLALYFTSTYGFFEFQISAKKSGYIVNSIELKAADGNIINFSSANMNITKYRTDPDFAKLFDVQGGTSKTELKIEGGGLSIPTSGFSSGYMSYCPFDAKGQKLTVTVKTTNNETFVFEIDGDTYSYGQYTVIPIVLEGKKPTKNIRVLSLSEIGCLGQYDNTKPWNNTYGATYQSIHTKQIRRILHDHFGPGKTVETGTISFEVTDKDCNLNRLTEAQLDKYDIIFLNYNGRPNSTTSRRIMNWLNKSPNRVLMLAYDWKDQCVTNKMSESMVLYKPTTNYMVFKNHIDGVEPGWYNGLLVSYTNGNYGYYKTNLFADCKLNEKTSYFWKDGPFKTSLNTESSQKYWIEDKYWGFAKVTDPNVIPLITHNVAVKGSSPCYGCCKKSHGCGHKSSYSTKTKCFIKPPKCCKDDCSSSFEGMVLGVDPTKRIVYVGDSEIFSVECVNTSAKQAARITIDSKGNLNNYGKIMANLWAWMIDEVVQKP